MITTGIHIPQRVLTKLVAPISSMQQETAGMTFAEWRKVYPGRTTAKLGCFIHVDFTKAGAVKSFRARCLDKPSMKFRTTGFETEIPMLTRPKYAAGDLAQDCGEFLLQREIERRLMKGQRELVRMTDDELSRAAEELQPINTLLAYKSAYCGSLSERFSHRLIQDEIETRGNEANHRRMKVGSDNADFVAACRKHVEDETVAAKEWREKKEAGRYLHFRVDYEFQKRSDIDQTVIAYRDAIGWQLWRS